MPSEKYISTHAEATAMPSTRRRIRPILLTMIENMFKSSTSSDHIIYIIQGIVYRIHETKKAARLGSLSGKQTYTSQLGGTQPQAIGHHTH